MTHLFSQSFLNIRTKLKHLDRGSLTLQAEVLGMTLRCTMEEMIKPVKNYKMLTKVTAGLPCPLGLKDHWVPISNVVKMVIVPGFALILTLGPLGHVQSAIVRDIGRLTASVAWRDQKQTTLQLPF